MSLEGTMQKAKLMLLCALIGLSCLLAATTTLLVETAGELTRDVHRIHIAAE